MVRWPHFDRRSGWTYVVSGLGALYVAVALGRVAWIAISGDPLAEALLRFVQIGAPGLALLYGGLRLPRTELRPEALPRVVTWCLGGAAVLLGVVGLLVLDPDVTVNHPLWSAILAASIGNLGGFAIGANEARAISRAREAEEHERTLQRQNDRLTSFASMLAHELRNPLNIAQIYVPQAADGDADAAEEAMTALDRIEGMIDVLLVTARNTDANVGWERVSLAEVAADAWADLSVERADLVVDTDREIRADPVHLRHLLENLFRNSIEHGDGTVTVRVGDLDSGFYVEDIGPGIPETEREAVFEAGYTTDADGIGLGLTFVAQLVETYDWDCEIAESATGGARFEFTNVDLAARKERRAN